MPVTVSVNVYQDGDLLRNCLKSVRENIHNPRIQVIDGRYESFAPDGPDNSTDETLDVADAYGAEYYPDGPHKDEQSKHWQRIERAPDGDRCLFIDADERLIRFDPAGLRSDAAYRIRIHNALMYEADVTYYSRYFYPGQMEDIPRVDRFSFDSAVERTDKITVVHRADLRDESYRKAKLERFEREDRGPWLGEYLSMVDQMGYFYADFIKCPKCGRESVTRSRVCGYDGDRYTWVEACTAADQCYTDIKEYEIDGYRYVPDKLDEGFRENISRVRVELMAAGNDIARVIGPEEFERYEENAKWWVRERYETA